ncbi:MAG: hypothetical protein HC846_02495 [Blastocatellia bacterium]|nr:hypothetical protein [Blastocatellia bacterium]
MKNLKFITIILAALLAFGGVDSFAQTKKKTTTRKKPALKKTTTKTIPVVAAKPAVKLYTVEQGQTVRVRMNGNITSKTAKVGDTFSTTVTEPVYSNSGVIVLPVGSTVTGKVTAVTPAGKGGKPGTIDVDFVEVRTPNGAKYAISGDLTELDTKTAKSDNEGTASGDKMKHRKVIFIGGGGAGGAIIGGAVGGGLGAAIGAGAGAITGLILESQTKGEEATVKANTEFSIYLNRAVSMPKFIEPVE